MPRPGLFAQRPATVCIPTSSLAGNGLKKPFRGPTGSGERTGEHPSKPAWRSRLPPGGRGDPLGERLRRRERLECKRLGPFSLCGVAMGKLVRNPNREGARRPRCVHSPPTGRNDSMKSILVAGAALATAVIAVSSEPPRPPGRRHSRPRLHDHAHTGRQEGDQAQGRQVHVRDQRQVVDAVHAPNGFAKDFTSVSFGRGTPPPAPGKKRSLRPRIRRGRQLSPE